MQLGTLAVFAVVSLFGHPAVAADAVTSCDRLAASPDDPKRIAPAVEIGDIKDKTAEAACRSALKASPDVARFHYQLGRALEAKEDYDAAMAEYQAAADKGYGAAADAEGMLFEQGLGREVDYDKAAEFYQRALDAGDVFAASDLGALHENGNGFAKDAAAAAPLYRKAANAGYADAQVHLGYLYENGSGVEQNDSEAVAWYRTAKRVRPPARLGHISPGLFGGQLLPHRPIVPVNHTVAGDRDPHGVLRKQQRPFPPIIPPIRAAFEHGPAREVKIDAAAQQNRSRKKSLPRRQHHLAAARGGASLHSFLNRRAVVGHPVAPGAVGQHIINTRRRRSRLQSPQQRQQGSELSHAWNTKPVGPARKPQSRCAKPNSRPPNYVRS